MGTRSDIIVERSDGKWHRIYSHWDGYLGGVGHTLIEHYNSQERAEALVAMGGMSILAESLDCPEGHTFDKPQRGYSVFYGRDRGDKDMEGHVGKNFGEVAAEYSLEEFTYVWLKGDDAGWHLMREDRALFTLKDAFSMLKQGHDPRSADGSFYEDMYVLKPAIPYFKPSPVDYSLQAIF